MNLYPHYRSRYLPAMTPAEIEAIPSPEKALVIVPTGAIEQHGPHLPVGVDAFMGQTWLTLTLEKVAADVPVYVTPAITIGKSNEHVGFPGTLFMSAKSLRRMVKLIVENHYALGFRKFAFMNTHGGNTSVVKVAMKELAVELEGISTTFLRSSWSPPVSAQEAVWGFHAGEGETAWMMAATEDLGLVDATVLPCEFPGSVDDPGLLRAEMAPATYSWVTADLSKSGVIGDASQGSLEKGKEWLDKATSALAITLAEMAAATSL